MIMNERSAICGLSIRVINNWNSLLYEVVNAGSLDSFKSKLDNAQEDKINVF